MLLKQAYDNQQTIYKEKLKVVGDIEVKLANATGSEKETLLRQKSEAEKAANKVLNSDNYQNARLAYYKESTWAKVMQDNTLNIGLDGNNPYQKDALTDLFYRTSNPDSDYRGKIREGNAGAFFADNKITLGNDTPFADKVSTVVDRPTRDSSLPVGSGNIRYVDMKDKTGNVLGQVLMPGTPDSTITSEMGIRDNVNTGKPQIHGAIDDSIPNGTVLGFPAYGKVVDIVVKSDENTLYQAGFGKSLEIVAVDVNGNSLGYKYILGHIEDTLVDKYDPAKNNIIQPGQAVALSGNNGHSTGPHLHTEIHKWNIEKNKWEKIESPTKEILEDMKNKGLAK